MMMKNQTLSFREIAPALCTSLQALPEEMALREANELSARLKDELNLSVGALILNRITTPLFDDAEVAALDALESGSVALTRMIAAARDRHDLVTLQRRYVETIDTADPMLRVPHVIQQQFDGPALADAIAAHLIDQPVAGPSA